MTALAAAPFPAQAQGFWETEQFDRPAPAPVIRKKPRVAHYRKRAEPTREATKPQGPLLIAVSIDKQQLKVYDSNGLFTESPVSTGMRGHSTPMGSFSVLGKEKYHRSNIYSGAPMPYMQRITWSGVAMHAGVLPGYPASHGCIRMPMNFATRMYGWTKVGARVVITPAEIAPSDFSHPLLVARKPEPANTASAAPAASTIVASAKPDQSGTTKQADGSMQPVRTADASGALPEKMQTANAADIKADKDQSRQDADGKAPGAIDSKDAPQPVAPPENKADTQAKPAPKDDKAAVPPKRTGHIAVFVSRKEGKLFVRQNFEPLFDVPVTIADTRPLGTHIFTLRAEKDDPKQYRWSVVSLPQRTRVDVAPRRKKGADVPSQAEAAPATTPKDALDRLTIPPEAMQKIAEAIMPGDSITVSDQGLGGETGLGTDFIVPLR